MGFLSDFMVESTVWSVTELTDYIRELFEIDFRLRDVEVEGEISNFVRARSGHLYFTLKDQGAQIKCVMWRTAAERMHFNPQDGDAVVAQGRISVYSAGGVYQLYAEQMTPAGRGHLALAFEQLKAKLNAEGFFDPEHKQLIPPFPRKIGIVTSADAAALRDILNVLARRCPLVSVLIAPTLVQGDQAPAQIVRALRWLDGRNDIDTIIIARGGGSMEDLWAFNAEEVVGAIFNAKHPIISGIGHEVDFTLTDFVADLRAPTPSAAAELAVPDLSEYQLALVDIQTRLTMLMENSLRQKKWQLQAQMQTLSLLSPRAGLDNNLQRLDGFVLRLEKVVERRLTQSQTALAVLNARLAAISPLATLSRGYAIVRGTDGRIIGSVADVTAGSNIYV
ncbi:MAG: exodeoxyribonuclease VII large subunit, partial [Anaerolineales bacterium]|nr:exodeoxyribonuclease VII large subunit [Anaerolineales bacterium]